MAGLEMSRDDVQKKLVVKAWSDKAFKAELLADPKGAIQKELGTELPADLNVKIMEEDANTLCLVIPMMPGEVEGKELSEEQLASVAGGGAFWDFWNRAADAVYREVRSW